MKFTDYWSQLLSQNAALKVGLVSVSIVATCLGFSLVSVAMREPILIERECITKQIRPAPIKVTTVEMERFATFVVSKRFDSDATDSGVFLTPEELATRTKELDEISKKGMHQRVFVNSVKVDRSKVFVAADRLLSFGKFRSALPLNLELSFKAIDRSPGNPYGLLLNDTTSVQEEGGNK